MVYIYILSALFFVSSHPYISQYYVVSPPTFTDLAKAQRQMSSLIEDVRMVALLI